MHRDVASPQSDLAIVVGRFGSRFGQIAVLDDLHRPVNDHHVAYFFHRITFANNLRRHLALGQQVMANQSRIA